MKKLLLAATALVAASAAHAQVPYSFGNQSGLVSASELDSDFSYLYSFVTPGGSLLTGPNSWGGLNSFNANIALPNVAVHGVLIGEGASGLSASALSAGQLLIGQGGSLDPVATTISGDATLNASGQLTVTKTNGSPLTSAATTAIGTSGATIPLLSGTNTASGFWAFNNGLSASAATISGISGSIQCLQVNASGVVSGTGGACGTPGFGSQPANVGLFSPNGASGSPSFRSMVQADIPTIASAAPSATTDRSLASRFGEVINVRDYGAVGDCATNDAAAFTAAVAAVNASGSSQNSYTELYIPPAQPGLCYLISTPTTLNVSVSWVHVQAAGPAATIKVAQTSGDFFVFGNSSAATFGLTLNDLNIKATGANQTSGALVHLQNSQDFQINGGRLLTYFGELWCEGCIHGTIANMDLEAGGNFTAFAGGSFLAAFTKSSLANSQPSEIHISGADWHGQVISGCGNPAGSSTNCFVANAVLIKAADGIFFDEPHLGFAQFAVQINPNAGDTVGPLEAVTIKGGYLDTCTLQCLIVQTPVGYTGGLGSFDFNLSQLFSPGSEGVLWNIQSGGTPNPSNLYVQTLSQAGFDGIHVEAGGYLNILSGWTILNPGAQAASGCAAAFTCNGIELDPGVTNVNIGQGTVINGNPHSNCAIYIGTATNFQIDRLRYTGMSGGGICDNSSTANKQFATPASLNW